jgi:hypothetical protein
MTRKLWLDLPPAVFARWRQVCAAVSDDSGRRLDDAEVFALMCEAAMGTERAVEERPRSQIAITVCARCDQAWQHGGGEPIALDAAALACARCDALEIGSIDGDRAERASSTIPPATRRFVWHRDGGRCRVPGCRSTKNLDIHHLVHQEDGGTHDAELLILACHSCHFAHHDGRITISGTASGLHVVRPSLAPTRATKAHVGGHAVARHGIDREALAADAITALVTAGFPRSVEAAAVARASDTEPPDLESLLRAALRSCAR